MKSPNATIHVLFVDMSPGGHESEKRAILALDQKEGTINSERTCAHFESVSRRLKDRPSFRKHCSWKNLDRAITITPPIAPKRPARRRQGWRRQSQLLEPRARWRSCGSGAGVPTANY